MAALGKMLVDRGLGDFVRNGASASPKTCSIFCASAKKTALRLCRLADNGLICRRTQVSKATAGVIVSHVQNNKNDIGYAE